MTALTFPTLVGVIGVILTALVNRIHWASNTKRWVSVGITVALIMVGTVFHYVPQAAEATLAAAGIAYGVSQVVFAALKPTGMIDWLTDITVLGNVTPAGEID